MPVETNRDTNREVGDKKLKKRSSTKAYAQAKDARAKAAKANKGARRRARTGEGVKTYRSDGRMISRSQTPGVSITLQLPALRRPKQAAKSSIRSFLKPIVLVPVGLIVAVVAIIGLQATSSSDTTAKPAAAATKAAPEFKTLKPSAEQASATKYDAKRELVTYTTTFSGARLTVSQQPLPPQFGKDDKALVKAADSINAKQRIDTAKGGLYVASNDKGKDQLAIFASSKALLLIHSDRQLDVTSWKSFIELLEEKS